MFFGVLYLKISSVELSDYFSKECLKAFDSDIYAVLAAYMSQNQR